MKKTLWNAFQLGKVVATLWLCLNFATQTAFAQQTELWGMTSKGGEYGGGSIFKTDASAGNQELIYSFPMNNTGNHPIGRLCKAANGKYYGVTDIGGKYNGGVIFEYDMSTNQYIVRHEFTFETGTDIRGGGLFLASNGKLYGTTYYGGINKYGVLYEFDPSTNQYTVRFHFDGYKGSFPYGELMQADNGKLYGTTLGGGLLSVKAGVIFEFDPATGTMQTMHSFQDNGNGMSPRGSLIQASNGKLYGLTYSGGSYEKGTIFEFDLLTETLRTKVHFTGANGANPYVGGMVESSEGKLYGVTRSGGANGDGVLFEYELATGTYTRKYSFSDGNAQPRGFLTLHTNGKLYGVTAEGGDQYSRGTLYEYDLANGNLTEKYAFNYTNGDTPRYGFLQEGNKLYGMTTYGGDGTTGIIYSYDVFLETIDKEYDFMTNKDKGYPTGSLLQASNGMLYGMTRYGGEYMSGTIFKINPVTYEHTELFSFGETINEVYKALGAYPRGSLIEGEGGKLFGIASLGGENYDGAIFMFDTETEEYTKLYDFVEQGAEYPHGDLLLKDGKLYGMSSMGGANDYGVIFEFDIATQIFVKKYDFDGTNGKRPYGSLIEASNGKLYGMSSMGGANDYGVIFEFDTETGEFTKKADFDGTNGKYPYGSLVQAKNGSFYGLTRNGGGGDNGMVFRFDLPDNSINLLLETSGYPYGGFMEAKNGKLYGMLNSSGEYNFGRIVELDLNTKKYNTKLSFNGENGNSPYYSILTEVTPTLVLSLDDGIQSPQLLTLYPNPAIQYFKLNIPTELLQIYSLEGTLVKVFAGQQEQFDISGLQRGHYVVRALTARGDDFSKIIILK